MSLYPESKSELQQIDYWIKNTVIQIIGDILVKDSNVIFYICDSEDARENQRHQVFEYWFVKAAVIYPYIKKYNYCIQSENGYNLNSSILYNADNYLEDYIINEFKIALGMS